MQLQFNANVPFDINKPVSHTGLEGTIPTVVAMVRHNSGQLILVSPNVNEKNANAYQFPQGPIKHRQTPHEAMQKLLHGECGLDTQDLELDQVSAVYRSAQETGQGKIKDYYFVFVTLCKGIHTKITEEVRQVTRSIIFVNDPSFFWDKMKDCSQSKQKLLVAALSEASRQELLPKKIWSESNMRLVNKFAGR